LLSDTSPSTISWIGSLQSALLMLVSVITGPFFDAGHFALMVPIGTLLMVFGMMMTSIANEYYQIMLAQGVCVGIGAGFLFLPAVALLPQYFKKRRSLANGIAATGSSIGGVIYPIMFHQLQQEIGFPWATRVLAFAVLATCLVSIIVMRLRFRPQQKRTLLQLSAFKEPQYVLFCLACFLGFLGFYNFLVYVQPYAIDTGIVDERLGFYLLAILNAASTFGRLLPNFAADYTGTLNMLIPALAATAILAYSWVAAHSAPSIIVLSALYGFFSGGFASLVPVGIIGISRDDTNIGARLGMCFAIESIGLLTGTPIGGAILSRSGSYLGLQLFCGSCLALCVVLFTVVRVLQSGWRLRHKC
jgi:predicted MFS family arabinose efflux permease